MKRSLKIILSFFVLIFAGLLFASCGSKNDSSDNQSNNNSSSNEQGNDNQKTEKYTVTWKNYDGEVLELDLNVSKGSMPSYDGNTPQRPSTNSASYTFIGWDKEVVAVAGNQEYIATFREQLKTYTVIWKNYDGEVLETDYNVPYGTMPEYNGFTPSRQKTAENTYTFNNWDKELTAVTKNEEYIATYTSTVNQYNISFVDDNGINLSLQKLNYGDSIVSPTNPSKASTAQYRYTFDGWYTSAIGGTKVTSFGVVTGDATFYARYTSVTNKYIVVWKDYDGKVLETDNNVEYGTMPEYNGTTPTRTADNTYTYSFNGWDKTLSAVTGNQEYIAVYTNTYKTYTVSISKNIQVAGIISGGGTYHYNDEVVLSASINSGYYFIGWYNGDTEVSKNISYKFNITTNNVVLVAKYASIEKCVVTFEVYGSELGIDAPEPQTIIKGETATQPDDLQTIVTDQYTITFGGWSKNSSSYIPFDFSTPITSNITIYAYWIVTVNKYTITFKNYDGEILQSSAVEYGTYPSYNGETPTKPATEEYIYIFKGWDKEVVKVVGLETYTAVFEEKVPDILTVTFMAKDSTNNYIEIYETQIKEGNVPEFDGEVSDYKYGDYKYTFAGWYPTITNIYEDTIYRAQYQSELLPFKINFNLNGGSGTVTSTQIELLSDLKTKNIFNIRKSNYKFVGWECNGIKVFDENGNIINDIDLEEEMTFTALFDESVLLTITYSVYDPINNTKLISTSKKLEDMGDTSETMYCKWNTQVNLVADEGVNYTFVGWYLNNSLHSTSLELNYMIWEQDITLEARFKYVKVKLNVYSNNTNLGQVMIKDGNSQTWYDSQSKYSYYSISMTIAANSTSDVAFLGWYDINNNLVSTDSVYTFNMINVDYKLEAKWNYFKITYSFPGDNNCSNGGTNNPDNPTYYTSDMDNLELYIPSRNGFTFVGWEYNGEIIEEIDTSNICHMTLTARWKPFDDLSNFNFTWNDNNITINNVIDKTVTEIIVPDYITQIAKGAFNGCSSLESITLPFVGDKRHISTDTNQYPLGYIFGTSSYTGGIATSQYYYASTTSTTNTTYYIPSTLKEVIITDCEYIQYGAFYNCSSLTNIEIPDSVTSIATNAFYGCNSLTNIEIPNSVESIGSSAFSNCTSLQNVYYDGTIEEWCNITFEDQYSNPMYYATNLYFLDENGNVEYHGNNYSLLTELIIPNTITSINKYQFYGFNELTSIVIPNSIISIGYEAFYNCSSLTSIEIPNSIESIGQSAFSGCSKLESITLPFVGDKRHISTDTYQYPLGYIFGTSSYTGGISTTQDYYGSSTTSTTYYIPSTLKEVIITDCEYIQYGAFYNCSSLTSIEIPNNVTSIGQSAFYGCSSLTNIVIPNSVESIGSFAFSGCSSLESITIPFVGGSATSNTYLGYIFGASSYSNNSSYVPTSLKEVIISEGCTSIVSYSFYKCSSLISITIPNAVTSIGQSAFEGCSSLTNIVIPNSVESIGQSAFYNCSKLTSIEIPNSVESIGSSAFEGCSSLENVYYDGTIEEWCNITFEDQYSNPMYYAKNLYFLDENGDIEYHGKKYSILPNVLVLTDGIEKINSYSFYNCSSLTSIEIPNSVESIGDKAFYGCSSLESITLPFIGGSATSTTYLGYIFGASSYSFDSSYIPSTLKEVIISEGCTSIGYQAFYDCSSLTSITIPNSVESIGERTFSYCSSLTSIEIPNSVTSIGQSAFSGCSKLESITLPFVGDKRHKSTDKYQYPLGYIFGTASYTGGTSTTQDYYESSTTSTTSTKYYIPSTLKEIIITDCEYIQRGAFYNCSKLTSITIPNSVTSIGNSAFYYCSSLTNIVIPNSVTSIGYGAFSGCSKLKSITIPFVGNKRHTSTDTYQYPLGYIFGTSSYTGGTSTKQYYYDSSTTSVTSTTYYIPSTLKEVIITDCEYIQYGAFYGCSLLTSIEIPNSVESIGSSAFYNCSSLTSIVIPNSVKSIGSSAFSNCTSLQNVYYDGTTEEWCNITFEDQYSNPMYYATNFYLLDDNGDVCYNGNNYSLLTELIIPNTITSINKYQFYGFNELTNIVIPNSTTSIASSAFEGCSSLENVYYDGTIEEWCNISFDNEYSNPMYYATNLYFLDENGNVEYHGKKYSMLPNELVIPNTITSINNYAFYGCGSLTSVVLSDSLISIGRAAFYSCSSLTSIEIPNSVESIGSSAFYGCESLESITLPFIGGSATSNTYLGYIFGASYYSNNSSYVPTSLKEVIISEGCTSIGSSAFSYCSSLTSIEIPNSVTSIGYQAFYNCSSLTSIEIPNSVTSIGYQAFYNCSSLQNVYYDGTIEEWCNITFSSYDSNPMYCATNLYFLDENGDAEYNGKKYIILPNVLVLTDGIEKISSYSFYKCSSLISATIPNSVESIGQYAFYGCSSLISITIPNSVESIGQYAFYGCSSLTSIEIPNSVESIGQYAFYKCSSLESITLPFVGGSATKNTYLGYIFGASSYSDNSSYVPTSLKEVIISDGCTSIGDRAFYRCSSLTSIEIPNSVESIGSYAFYSCSSLQNVYYDGTIEEWCNISFDNEYSNPMYYATNLYFLDEDGDIEYNGKKYSILPNELVIPDTVTSIGQYAFYKCSSLESITLPFVGGSATSNTYLGYIFGASSSSYNSDYVPSSLKKVIISEGCTSIGEYAFYDCSSLTSIEIPNSVESIGQSAFYECSSLTSIEIPNSVESIGQSSFYYCSSLESITLPFVGGSTTDNTYLGHIFGASSYSSNSSYIPTSLKEVIISDGCTNIASNAFKGCSSLTNIEIPNSVESIGESAFYECSSLTGVVIPNSVTSIGSSAFSNCTSLQNVYYDGTIEEWCNITFGNSSSNPMCYATNLYFLDENGNVEYHGKKYSLLLNELVIPNTIVTINNYAFYGCSSLTSIVIPNSVESIGRFAFYGCESLESITLPFIGGSVTSNTYFGYIFGASSYSDNSSYVPTSLKEVIISEGCTNIASNAFYDCSSLTNIEIPNSVESIGSSAFYNCSKLTSIEIPNSVESISASAFYNCSKLTSIEIPNSVTSIGQSAFSGCSSLTSIEIPNSVTSIGESAFYGCYKLVEIYNFSTLNITEGETSNGYAGYYAIKVHTYLAEKSILTIDEDYIFAYYDNNAYLVGYFGNDIDIILPNSFIYNNETITNYKINKNAFYECSSITSVVIPDSVTSIGQSAFYKCRSLKSITIPNSVTSIGYEAFSNCTSLEDVYYDGTIEEWCNISFDNEYSNPMCYATNLYFLDENGDAEYNSKKYSLLPNELVIPDTVTSIGQSAFYGCELLESITLPFIGGSATKNTYLGYIFGASSYSSNSSYIPTSLKEVIISEGCTSIGQSAFYNCSSLTSVVIPNSVTSIGQSAFYGCSSLTNIVIPNSVTSIGYGAFSGCSSLESITIPFVGDKRHISTDTNQYPLGYIFGTSSYTGGKSTKQYYYYDSSTTSTTYETYYIPSTLREVIITDCEYIQYGSFYNCKSLTSIVIPNSVESIRQSAFYGCSSLESITLPFVGDKRHTSTDTYQYPLGYIFGTSSYTGGTSTKQFYYGSSTTGTTNTTYYIPSTLRDVIITNCEYIQCGAFYGCSSLTNIEIPDSVTSIATYAFSYCSSLTSIEIPSSVTSIGYEAFSNCTSLEDVYYDGTIEEWCNITFSSYDSNPMYYAANLYFLDEDGDAEYNGKKYSILPNVLVLTDGIEKISSYSFYNCSSLISIKIPNSVESIGQSAFYKCSSLESITLPFVGGSTTDNTYLGYIFGASSYSFNSSRVPTSLKEVIISDGCTSIGESAFDGCSSLTSVVIPNSVTSIGSSAFYSCSSLQNVYYDGTIEEWCNISFDNEYSNPMYYATNLYFLDEDGDIEYNGKKYSILPNELVIPNTIISIKKYTFTGCNLTSITIKNSVTSIEEYAFYNCKSLVSVEIGNAVKSIGSSAFMECRLLTNITFDGKSDEWLALNVSDLPSGFVIHCADKDITIE